MIDEGYGVAVVKGLMTAENSGGWKRFVESILLNDVMICKFPDGDDVDFVDGNVVCR